jgi:heme-degrading monooxygenase HmoA
MYSSTFIFSKKQFDSEFYRLDQAIAEAAKEIPGYLGEEAWENTSTGLVSNVYYWQTLEALQELIKHPKHQEAKAKQANWLDGYQVIISEVIKSYGDSKLTMLTASNVS